MRVDDDKREKKYSTGKESHSSQTVVLPAVRKSAAEENL